MEERVMKIDTWMKRSFGAALVAALALAACGDDSGGKGTGPACEDGFVAVGGVCRMVEDANNGGDNNGTNNGGDDVRVPEPPDPYTCDYVAGSGYAPQPNDACNLVTQDCPEAEGCLITADGAACLPAGTAGCGDPCTLATDCEPGLLCAGSPSRCLVPCEPGTACQGDSLCAPLNGREDLGVCAWPEPWTTCDVFASTCPTAQGCYLIEEFLVCAPTGINPAAEGESCAFANGCEPGLICGGSETAPTCRRPCTADGDETCPGDGACAPLRGLEPLGLCF